MKKRIIVQNAYFLKVKKMQAMKKEGGADHIIIFKCNTSDVEVHRVGREAFREAGRMDFEHPLLYVL
jgi:hypothetical protein